MADLERTYTIPLRSSFRNAAKYRKTNKAVKAVREFLMKHMKATDVKLGQNLNLFLWKDGIKNPPPRVTVHCVKDAEGIVRAELEGKAFKESIKPIPKEEEGSLKDKLVDKIAGKEQPEEKEKKSEKPAPKATPKVAPASPKKDAPKAPPKKEESKDKPKAPPKKEEANPAAKKA